MLMADAFYWTGASKAQLGYQEHGALIGLCAVLFIVGGLAWLIDSVAHWLDDRAEERQQVAQQREDERVDALVDAFAARMLADEARLKATEEQLAQILSSMSVALNQAETRGYDRGWLHGSTGKAPETHATNGSATRPLHSV
ncbi:hypothetical protein [Phytohabitans aurantiacus]|nr:hypothetical protein [Phytohabitans aurantiacus]